MRRPIVPILLAMALALGIGATPADASRVVDVRVGAHSGYTRVVLQLDEASEYRIRRQQIPSPTGEVTELAVEVDGATGAFALGGRRGIVDSVRVKTQGTGAVALIRLSVSGPRVADMTLKNPDRIVIDVRPPATKAKASPPPPPPAPKVQAEAPPAATAAATAGTTEGVDDPEPAAEAMGESGEDADDEQEAAAPPAPPPPARAQPAPPPTQVPDSSGGGIGFLPIAAVIGVLLLGWVFLRRRSEHFVEEPSDSLPEFPAVDGIGDETVSEEDLALPEVEASAEAAEEDEDLPAVPGQPVPPPAAGAAAAAAATTGVTVPPASEVEVEPPAEPEPEAPTPAQEAFPGLGAAPAAAAAAAAPEGGSERILQEIERRLRHIETRIEEIADSRERTDRQLAAHTEELRVQRSAIARAQRVLRNLTRPDEPSEPVPKGPGEGS